MRETKKKSLSTLKEDINNKANTKKEGMNKLEED